MLIIDLEKGKLIIQYLRRIAIKKGIGNNAFHLTNLLQVKYNSGYLTWKKSLNNKRLQYNREYDSTEKELVLKFLQILVPEFSTEEKWRSLLNSVTYIQVINPLHNLLSELKINGIVLRETKESLIYQAKIIGNPNPEKFIGELFIQNNIPNPDNYTSEQYEEELNIKKRGRQKEIEEIKKKLNIKKTQEELREVKENAAKINVEIEFWRQTKEKNDFSAYEKYLKRYPNGNFVKYATQAKEKLKKELIEIQAGIWTFYCESPVFNLTGGGSIYRFILRPNGSLEGVTQLGIMGMNMESEIRGNWNYDFDRKVLDVSGQLKILNIGDGDPFERLMGVGQMVANQMPQQFISFRFSRITTINKSRGIFKAIDTEGNSWRIEKTRN